jgi:AraC family transcriptional regulator of adaptative response/methylated-DNA-[protein]-cysteine methyltransferase
MEARTIGYDILECEVGKILLAATSRGVCRVRIGDDPGALVSELREEFPFAEIHSDAVRMRPWVEAFERYLAGRTQRLEVPLDVRASQFQRRVWDALCAIPYGRTRSYSEVAARVGQPRAARAVARACASNPVALAVPCHRVVASGGEPGGYRWGVERKRWLLDLEHRSLLDAAGESGEPVGQAHLPAVLSK